MLCLETFAGISVDLQPVARVAWLNRPIWAGYSRLLGYAGFGLSTLGTAELIRVLKQDPGKPMAPAELLKIFKTYHN